MQLQTFINKASTTFVLEVRLNMFQINWLFIEAFVAKFTHKPVFSCVNRQVIQIPLFAIKWYATVVAMVLHAFMFSHMFIVLRFINKSLLTHVTIRFKLSCVHSHVSV